MVTKIAILHGCATCENVDALVTAKVSRGKFMQKKINTIFSTICTAKTGNRNIFISINDKIKFQSYKLPKGSARIVQPASYHCIQFNTQFIMKVRVLQRAMTLLIFKQLAHYKAEKCY